MDKERVKYFQAPDLFFGYMLDKIKSMEIPDFLKIDINDAIEYYEIKCYFDNGVHCENWSEEQHKAYAIKSEKLFGLTQRFFSNLSDDSILGEFSKVDREYTESFWTLFEHCKLYDKISNDVFNQLLLMENIDLSEILYFDKIVNRYGECLKSSILEKEYGIHLLLEYFEQEYQLEKKKKIFLPTELSGKEICDYFEKYCDSEKPNPNYLETIYELKTTKKLPITDELRLKVQRKLKSRWSQLDKNSGVHHEMILKVGINDSQDIVVEEHHDASNVSFSYSKNYLMDTTGNPDILNNFIYLFDYVDVLQQRCNFVSKQANAGTIEKTFRKQSKRHYLTSYAFNIFNNLSTMQMQCYYDFLNSNGIFLEDVLHWCFTSYLHEEFNCDEMRITMPSKESTYAEKCANIIIAFDAVIKQFTKYVENGEIDFELIQMSTKPISFESIPSLNEHKYIYGNGKEFENISLDLSNFSECKKLLREAFFEPKNNIHLDNKKLIESKEYLIMLHQKKILHEEGISRAELRKILFDYFSPRGKNIAFDSSLKEIISEWEIVIGRQYLTISIELIWKYMLERLNSKSMPIDLWINDCLNSSEWMDLDKPVKSIIHNCNYSFEERETMIAKGARGSKNTENNIENAIKIMLSIYNRFVNREDVNLNYLDYGGNVSISSLIDLVNEFFEKPIGEFAAHIMVNWIVKQHEKTAFEKMLYSGESRDGYYIENIEGTYVFRHDMYPDFQGIRLIQLNQVMKDLDMFEENA